MTIKTLLTAAALTLLPGLALAMGCHGSNHAERANMSCAAGTTWDADSQTCVAGTTS
ncbi:MAG: adenylosuccinate lyase [Paracoccaceae bacterium]|jgi:hypothetical protein|nr:adenylosuccinate lyase [Paracoccaceae bacterium]